MADDDYQDPALKSFNRTGFQVKHVVGKTLMGGLIGALIGAAIAVAFVALIPLAAGPIGMAVSAVAGALGLAVPGVGAVIAPFLIHAAITGAMLGGGVGAVINGAISMGNAGEAADDEEQRLITKSRQTELRRQAAEAMEQRRDMQAAAMQQQTMAMRGANPNQSLPSVGGGGPAYSA
jgi:hypothetical protein